MTSTDLVRLDADLGGDKHEVIRALAAVVAEAGRATDTERLVADVLAREDLSPTGLPGGIALPHCRSTAVTDPTVAVARLARPVDFGAADGPADLAFLIAAPVGGEVDHLTVLSALARALVRPVFSQDLRSAGSAQAVVDLVAPVLPAAPAARRPPEQRAAAQASTEQAQRAPERPVDEQVGGREDADAPAAPPGDGGGAGDRP